MTESDAATADTLAGGARTGQVLCGKYQLVRLLGRGGMGEVYEARHVVVGRRFAAKFLHASPVLGSGAAARFLREAQAAGALESPHLAAVLDFDVAPDGAPFLVMEYLQGESLSRVLRREGRLPVPRVVSLLLQACAGLEVAHGAGIVHRDLKPDNLFLVQGPDAAEQLKIVDFGIAKLVGDGAGGDATQSGAVLGTPYYMAPEQARGERTVDQRVDLHALGVIAYELLSGRKPHPGDSYNAILAHILTEPVEPLAQLRPNLPKQLVAVIERAMAFDPAARQPSAAALASELGRFAGRELRLRGEALDLSESLRDSAAPAGVATLGDTHATGETPGTLQSAVGDVQPAPAGSSSRGTWGVLAVAAIASAGYWFVASRTSPSQSPAASSVDAAAPARPIAPAVTATPGERAAAPATEPAPERSIAVAQPKASALVTSKPQTRLPVASAVAPRPARVAAPPPVASYPAPAASQVTFDEKNPY